MHPSRAEEISVDEAALVPSTSKRAKEVVPSTSKRETVSLVSSSSKREAVLTSYNARSTDETTLVPYTTPETAINEAVPAPNGTSKREDTSLSERALVPTTRAIPIQPPEDGNFRHRKKMCCSCCSNKICFGITIVTVILLVALLLFLIFYIFKARKPEIISQEVKVKNLIFSIEPATITLTLGINIALKNRNFVGWKYKASNTTLYYHGPEVGLATVPAGVVHARSNAVVNATINVDTTAMTSSKYLLKDLKSGYLPLDTYTIMAGKVLIIKIIKIHATVYSNCTVNVTLSDWNTTTTCQIKV